jgi:membrane protease YdiL (CAAX protease family)
VKTRIVALLEVVAVLAGTLSLIAAVATSPVEGWQRRVTSRAFVEYALMIGGPLLCLLGSRRSLASYGVSLQNLRDQLNAARTAFIPVAVASVAYPLVNYREWNGALILTAINGVLLLVVARLLERKPAPGGGEAPAAVSLVWLAGGLAGTAAVVNAVSALVFYVFFLGLGEELLFRGYIQSRLNIAFGRPFRFFGIQWGYGAVIASALFGLMHVINLGGLVSGHWHLTPWWGLWTSAGGLVFAFVREKTGGIVAPAILHGLPQGIACAFLGR